jgi:hypothetical protein
MGVTISARRARKKMLALGKRYWEKSKGKWSPEKAIFCGNMDGEANGNENEAEHSSLLFQVHQLHATRSHTQEKFENSLSNHGVRTLHLGWK